MDVTHDTEKIKLTVGEISELFLAYLSNSASTYVISYMHEKAQDADIKSVIKMALDISENVVKEIKNIFKSTNHPIPTGFSEKDVKLNAKQLFSDKFMIMYIRYMARFGLTNYSESRASITREDIRSLINNCITSNLELINAADEVMLKKGLYFKEPSIPIPDKVDFVEKQSFLSGFWGDKRPLNASEINRLYLNYLRNSMGKAFLTGLCQTVKNDEIKRYLLRGKTISQNHLEILGDFLKKEDLPIPPSIDSEISDSTESLYSDKLIMFSILGFSELALGINGVTLSKVMRRDLSLAITRFISEIALYAEDGANIMIAKEWLERIPEAVDRKELIGV